MSGIIIPNPTPSKLTVNEFVLKVLNGMGVGIVLGLISNALCGQLFAYLATNYGQQYPFLKVLQVAAITAQWSVPALIGAMIGFNFKFTPLKICCVSVVAFIAAGNVIFTPDNGFIVRGIGDILNILLNTSLACLFILFIKDKFGSLSIILVPLFTIVLIGFISHYTLSYMKAFTELCARSISYFTQLSPWLAGPLIGMAFSFAIASPLSSVALSLITAISGQAAGAASVGCAASQAFLMVTCYRSNGVGCQVALFIGVVKMMVPNLIEKPMAYVGMILVGGVSGFFALNFTDIVVSTSKVGFGASAFIGPIDSWGHFAPTFSTAARLTQLIVGYAVVPFVTAIIVHILFTRVAKFYTSDDFVFNVR